MEDERKRETCVAPRCNNRHASGRMTMREHDDERGRHCRTTQRHQSALPAARDSRHAKRNALFLKLGLVHGANLRRLVLVLKQMAAFMFA